MAFAIVCAVSFALGCAFCYLAGLFNPVPEYDPVVEEPTPEPAPHPTEHVNFRETNWQ